MNSIQGSCVDVVCVGRYNSGKTIFDIVLPSRVSTARVGVVMTKELVVLRV